MAERAAARGRTRAPATSPTPSAASRARSRPCSAGSAGSPPSGPIVLALEDLHVADAATRSFATFIARIARDERIALVLTYQPDRLTREHPLRENLAVIEAGPPAAGPGGPRAPRAARDRRR